MPEVIQFPSPTVDYVEIPLSHGQVALVSPEDAQRVQRHKWSASCIKGVWYASRGKMRPNGKQSIEYLHRFILAPQPGQRVDHADGNTLDNRRQNIRIATASQNSANRHGRGRNNTSGYTGVRPTTNGKYIALIGYLGTVQYIGTFDTAIEAARARDFRAIDLFGPFAGTNFPPSELLQPISLPIAA